MRVKLLKDARIKHKAGEIVDVSPEEYMFLTGVFAAEPVKQTTQTKTKKRTTKK